jgi:hypothetical protein
MSVAQRRGSGFVCGRRDGLLCTPEDGLRSSFGRVVFEAQFRLEPISGHFRSLREGLAPAVSLSGSIYAPAAEVSSCSAFCMSRSDWGASGRGGFLFVCGPGMQTRAEACGHGTWAGFCMCISAREKRPVPRGEVAVPVRLPLLCATVLLLLSPSPCPARLVASRLPPGRPRTRHWDRTLVMDVRVDLPTQPARRAPAS